MSMLVFVFGDSIAWGLCDDSPGPEQVWLGRYERPGVKLQRLSKGQIGTGACNS
jgi:hypothetical protein